jgi:hypothetical protein
MDLVRLSGGLLVKTSRFKFRRKKIGTHHLLIKLNNLAILKNCGLQVAPN